MVGWTLESDFAISLVTLTTFVISPKPVPLKIQVFSSKISVIKNCFPVAGSKSEVIGDPHVILSFTVSWVVNLSPILKIFLSFVTNL